MACSSLLSEDDLRRFRTKPCRRNRHQRGGSCEFGPDRCQYSHSDAWPRRCPFYLSNSSSIRYIPKVCSEVVLGDAFDSACKTIGTVAANKCTRGGACPFAHSLEEILYHPLHYKTQTCPHFQRGECTTYYCPFIHGTAERRDISTVKYNLPFTNDLFGISPFPNVEITAKIPTPSKTQDQRMSQDQRISSDTPFRAAYPFNSDRKVARDQSYKSRDQIYSSQPISQSVPFLWNPVPNRYSDQTRSQDAKNGWVAGIPHFPIGLSTSTNDNTAFQTKAKDVDLPSAERNTLNQSIETLLAALGLDDMYQSVHSSDTEIYQNIVHPLVDSSTKSPNTPSSQISGPEEKQEIENSDSGSPICSIPDEYVGDLGKVLTPDRLLDYHDNQWTVSDRKSSLPNDKVISAAPAFESSPKTDLTSVGLKVPPKRTSPPDIKWDIVGTEIKYKLGHLLKSLEQINDKDNNRKEHWDCLKEQMNEIIMDFMKM